MPSVLLRYSDGKVHTKELQGVFRSFAWSPVDASLILVGDHGRIVKVENGRFVDIASGTRQNLRGISVNSRDGSILVVGNAGTVVQLDERGLNPRVTALGPQNLRAVSWNLDGTLALIAGNGGTLSSTCQQTTRAVEGGRANFRHVSWRPNTKVALVTSNCFAEEFIPSPNLFSYDMESGQLNALNEGRADLIGADWKPDGTIAIVVGYDVIWHNGAVTMYDGHALTPIEFPSKQVYPVAVSWNPKEEGAAIVTAATQLGTGNGTVYLWNGKETRTIFRSKRFFFSSVNWNKDGTEMVALGSSATRTFNC